LGSNVPWPFPVSPWPAAASSTCRFRIETRERRQLIIDLDHVDAAIRIFDPNYDVAGIRQNIPSAAHRATRGDMTRATLDALRDAPGPMTTKELARHVMAERGLNTADAALLQLFTRRTGALLRWQKKRGILRSVKDPKHGRFDLWEIAV
jgi:hypothetical protein